MANSTTGEAVARRASPMLSGLVLMLFLVSGFAGLVYEIIWSRMLTYVFGATLYAVSTVLAAYMGGLALGSFLFGRWVDRRRNPLRVYAILELGIALGALAVPWLLREGGIIAPLFQSLYESGEPSFAALTFVRLLLTLGVLLIPTTLMGATLPVLSKWAGRTRRRLGLSLGTLYAINTFGAVAGCYVTGFHGIEALGVTGMMMVAVAINAAVGVVAFALSAMPAAAVEPQPTEPQTPAPSPTLEEPADDVTPLTARMVFWFFGLSGAVALAYQVTWWRSLVFSFDLLKNTTYAFTAMLAVFLVGLAAGSAIMTLLADRLPEPVRCFSLLQLGIGLMGAFSFLVIQRIAPNLVVFEQLSEDATEIYFTAAVANTFIKTGAAILLPTLLMGMAYPVAVRICVPSLARVGRTVGDLYSVNTLGAILGALAAGFILVPKFGIAWTIFLLFLANVAMAVVLTLNIPTLHPTRRYLVIGLAALCVAILLFRFPFRARFHQPEPLHVLRYYEEGPLATVSVMENVVSGVQTLHVDKVGVAGTDRILLTDQKSLAHVPMLFLDDPKVALTVGYGSGGASYSYLRYDSLEKLRCIEICRTVLNAGFLLGTSNHGLFVDPMRRDMVWANPDARYRVIIDDVRSYLHFSPQRYDIIATDCTDLRYKTNANLYDYEYFRLCRDSLTSGGMVVAWMPLGGLSPETFRLALRTFYKAFPLMSIWYMNNEPTHYILLVGPTKPLQIDYKRMREKLQQDKVRTDLHELLLEDADKLLSCYLTDHRALASALGDGPVNRENYPYLEYQAPRYGYSEQPLFDNLDWLLQRKNSIEPLLAPGSYEADDLKRIETFRSAVPDILEGHKYFRLMKYEQATNAYLRAREAAPDDRTIDRMLAFEPIQARLRAAGRGVIPPEVWPSYHLGRSLMLQKRYEGAISRLEYCVRIGQAAKQGQLHNDTVAQIHNAAKWLRQIYTEKGKSAALQDLEKRIKDLPSTSPQPAKQPAAAP